MASGNFARAPKLCQESPGFNLRNSCQASWNMKLWFPLIKIPELKTGGRLGRAFEGVFGATISATPAGVTPTRMSSDCLNFLTGCLRRYELKVFGKGAFLLHLVALFALHLTPSKTLGLSLKSLSCTIRWPDWCRTQRRQTSNLLHVSSL